jgi:hypothetical protein
MVSPRQQQTQHVNRPSAGAASSKEEGNAR